MNRPQVIFNESGQPVFAVIPWREYERLAEDAGALLSDEELYDRAKTEDDESFPSAVADRLVAGQNPVSVYRSYRRMTQSELAAAAGINAVYLSQIETGKRTGSAKTLATLARVLNVSVDDLM